LRRARLIEDRDGQWAILVEIRQALPAARSAFQVQETRRVVPPVESAIGHVGGRAPRPAKELWPRPDDRLTALSIGSAPAA
jgi:hypothetical protein